MADLARVKPGDVVEATIHGDHVLAIATGAPEKVSPRVYELPIQVHKPGHWQRGERYKRVRARQVTAVYRRLKNGSG